MMESLRQFVPKVRALVASIVDATSTSESTADLDIPRQLHKELTENPKYYDDAKNFTIEKLNAGMWNKSVDMVLVHS
jgi:hypothetical protein